MLGTLQEQTALLFKVFTASVEGYVTTNRTIGTIFFQNLLVKFQVSYLEYRILIQAKFYKLFLLAAAS